MDTHTSPTRRALLAGGRIAGHWAAMAAGVIMMLVGLSLGVTMVLLPLGLPLGLAGLLLTLWGVSTQFAKGHATARDPMRDLP